MHIHAHCVKLTTLCVSKNFDCAIKILNSKFSIVTTKQIQAKLHPFKAMSFFKEMEIAMRLSRALQPQDKKKN